MGIILRWQKGAVAAAMARWGEAKEEAREARAKASKVVKRMINMRLAQALERWASNASSQREARHRCRR
eukprot:715172-Hanusia_phi.AAC.1